MTPQETVPDLPMGVQESLVETSGHSWAGLVQFLLRSLLLSPGSWSTQGFVCSLQESVFPVLCKFCSKMEQTKQNGAVTPQETDPDLPGNVQESPVEAWVSGGLLQVEGTECSRACMGPFEGVTIIFITSTIEPPELTQDWENRLLEGTNKTLCAPGPRRKEQ